MPGNNPQVGELWQLQTSEEPVRGVVHSVSRDRVSLLSQIGRSVSIPHGSFNLSWSFVRGAPRYSCEYEGCPSGAIVQLRNMGGWRWVCSNHLQPGVDIRFDSEPGSERTPTLEACPNCNAATNHMNSGTAEIAGRFLMHWCGNCGERWVLLVSRGTPQDGYWATEAIQDIRSSLEALGLRDLRCLMGHSLANRIRDLSSVENSPPHVMSIPVTTTDHFGDGQAVLLAKPGPVEKPLEEEIFPDPSRGSLVSPAVGSVWWDKLTKERVRVIASQSKRGATSLIILTKSGQQELPLENFHTVFENTPPTIDTSPIQMGDLWSYCGETFRVLRISGRFITMGGEKEPISIEEEDLRKLWIRVRVKSSMERLLEEDLF